MKKVKSDTKHGARESPKGKVFDNNYLYYLYLKGYDEWWRYDDAREYLFKHIGQIVDNAKPMSIPVHMFLDIRNEMYMLVDELYRSIFEDEKIYKIVSKDWLTVTEWSKFEKYYQPNQVYWYIKVTLRWRILDYIKRENNNELICIDNDREWLEDFNWENHINNEMLINVILSNMLSLWDLEKAIFIYVYIKQKSLKETRDILNWQWIDISIYRIRKIVNNVMVSIKDSAKDFIKDFE